MSRGEYPLLSLEDEREYIKRAQNGDKEAFDYLVLSNQGWVHTIARHFINESIEQEDLRQVGTMGLMHAIRKYDLNSKAKLATYATSWIKQYIIRNIQIYSRTIRTPCHLYNKNFRMMVDIKKLEQELGYTPNETEILENLEITQKELKEYQDSMRDTCSLNVVMTGKGEGDEMVNQIKDDNQVDMTSKLQIKEFAEVIKSVLNEKQYSVFVMKTGLENGVAMLDKEIAEVQGISKQAVNQMYQLGVARLRRNSKIKMFA